MNCAVILIRESDNKILKNLTISEDTYLLCQSRVDKMNEKLKEGKRYVLTTINI